MNTQRTRQVIFRCTEDEWKKIHEKILKSGSSQQDFLLKAALGKRVFCLDDMGELMTELKRQGNNLNQMTRKLHQGEDISAELPELEKELKEVWQQLRRYLLRKD